MLGRILVFIGLLLVIALSAALVAPYFVDWTNFRHDFEMQASRIVGKKVVVHGKVDARILPFPSVTLSDVRVGEDETGTALVTIDHFSMESELAPFLSGEALIYNMRIDHPKVTLRLTNDGTLDWVKTGKPVIPASSIVLEHVDVNNGDILFIDEQTGRNRHVTGLDLDVSAKTLAGPWKVSGSGALDGKPGTFVMDTGQPEDNGKLHLKLRVLPQAPAIVAELDGTIGLSNMRPLYSGSFRIREKNRLETSSQPQTDQTQTSTAPRVSGDFELQNDRLRIPKYEFQMGDPADPYIVNGEATIDAGRQPQFLLTAEGQQIDMSRFGGANEGTADDKALAIPLKERVRAVLALANDLPIPPLPGKATIKLPALVTSDSVIRDITLNMRPDGDGWQIDEAQAELPGRTTLQAKGRLTLGDHQGFSGDLILASTQPSGFAEWVTGKVPEAIRKLKTAGFSASVDLTPDRQRFENLEIAFGTASLKGRLENQSTEDGPSALSIDLAGNQFDLDTVLALGGLITGENTSRAIAGHQMAAKLRIDDFTAFGMRAKGLDTSFSLINGAIRNARLKMADFYGATISSAGSMADPLGTPNGEFDVSLKSPDPSALFQLLASRLPTHPLLNRLAHNASYYQDADLGLHVKLGLGDWPIEAALSGTAHGSRIKANLAAQTINLANSGGLSLEASIDNPDAWVMAGQAGLSAMQFDADQDGLLTLKVDQPPDGDTQISLGYNSSTTNLTLDGNAALDAAHFLNGSYQLSLKSNDFAPYLIMNGMTLPRLAEGLPVTLTSAVYATSAGVSFETIGGKIDGDEITGSLAIEGTGANAKFGGELTLGEADLGWIAENIYGQIADPMTGTLSAKPLPIASSLPVTGTIALSAKHFQLGNLGDISDFTGNVEASNGRISIDKASGGFGSGRFTGKVEIGNTDGTGFFRSQVAISGAKLNTMFWQTLGKPVAEGKADISLVLESTGKSPAELLSNATGSGEMTLGKLVVSGLNSKALAPILATADATNGDIVENLLRGPAESSLFSSVTHLDTLKIPFAITGGKFRADDITAAERDMTAEGAFAISLTDASLDASLRLSLNPGEDAIAGADPAITITWTGPFNAPVRQVNLTDLTGFLTMRKIEQEQRRVEILQAKVSEKQRLRREASLYRARDAERQRLKEKAANEVYLLQHEMEMLKALAIQEEEDRKNATVDPNNGDVTAPAQ